MLELVEQLILSRFEATQSISVEKDDNDEEYLIYIWNLGNLGTLTATESGSMVNLAWRAKDCEFTSAMLEVDGERTVNWLRVVHTERELFEDISKTNCRPETAIKAFLMMLEDGEQHATYSMRHYVVKTYQRRPSIGPENRRDASPLRNALVK